jgi:hypothetical protein
LQGIEREEHEKLIFEQRVDQRSPRLLQADSHRPTAEASAEFTGPGVDFSGLLRQLVFDFDSFGPEAHRMLLIAPVNSYKRGEFVRRHGSFSWKEREGKPQTRWLEPREILIVEAWPPTSE